MTKEDQEYGPWIRVGPVAMFRKDVVRVLGFYEYRKKKASLRKNQSDGEVPLMIEKSRPNSSLVGQVQDMESADFFFFFLGGGEGGDK